MTVDEKIESLKELVKGWHYGLGEPFTQEQVTRARKWAGAMTKVDFAPYDIYPGVDGSMLLVGRNGDMTLDVMIDLANYEFYLMKDDVDGELMISEAGDNPALEHEEGMTASLVKLLDRAIEFQVAA